MPRLDRTKLDGAQFPVVESVPTRWGDLDLQGHVNNAIAVAILQEGRVRFNYALGLPRLTGDLRAMVVGLTVEYAAELLYPDPIEIGTGVLAIGRTSFTVGQVMRQRDRTAIYAEVTMVLAAAAGAVPVPPVLHAALDSMRIVSAPPA